MTTPLQTAAQAVIARWESPKWKDEAPTAVVIGALRKALTDEQAQSVEPVAWLAADQYGNIGLSLKESHALRNCEAGTKAEPLFTHPAPPAQAVEPVATVQCINGVTIGYLDVMQPVGTKLYTHPAPPATGERADLIADLRLNHEYCPKEVILFAADMLEADAQEIAATERQVEADVSLINEGNKAQQVAVLTDIEQYRMQMAGICTAALGYWSEGDDIHPDYDTPALRDVARLYVKYDQLFKEKEERRAQQVAVPARGPLSDSEINAIWSEPLDRSKLSPFGMSRIRAILAAANDIGDKS